MINGIDVSNIETGAVIASNSCFELYLKRGVGIHNTLYEEFKIRSIGDADKFGIIITSFHTHSDYRGEPVSNDIEEFHLNISASIIRNLDDIVPFSVAIIAGKLFIEECNKILHIGGTDDNA